MRRLAYLVVTLVALTGLSTGPATAAESAGGQPHEIAVLDVPTGPHPRVAYLTGRLLHTASGKVIGLPFPAKYQDSLELLVRGPDGWIVVYHHTATIYEVSASGMAHLLFHYWYDQGYEGYSVVRLNSNHTLISILEANPGNGSNYDVFNLAGFQEGYHSWAAPGGMAAFRGRSLYFARPGKLDRWRFGHPPTDTGLRHVRLLDLAHHRFLQETFRRHRTVDRLVSTTHPSRVRWSLCLSCHGRDPDYANSFSPDGARLAYLYGDPTYVLPGDRGVIVRSASDGHAITDLHFDQRVWKIRWEDARHLLVEVVEHVPGQNLYQAPKAVLRCDLGGHCERVTEWQHHFILDYEPPGGL